MGDGDRILEIASLFRSPPRTIESTVRGGSMVPTLRDGDRIQIQLTDRDDYDVGEIVAFLVESHVVVHRIVHVGRRRAAGSFMTRGDRMVLPDSPIECARLLGPVVGVARRGAWVACEPARRSTRIEMGARPGLLVLGALGDASPRLATRALLALNRFEAMAWRRHARRHAASIPG